MSRRVCGSLYEKATMRRTIKAVITRGEKYWVAECLKVGVVTQGETLDETLANLREAVGLFLDGEDPAEYDLVPHPTLLITLEAEPITHAG